MKTLTIKEPYANLIANKYKNYEIRSWKTKYRGEILIHAGKGIDKKKISELEQNNYDIDYPNSVIVAKTNITDCIYIDEEVANKIYNLDKIVYKNILNQVGNYAWKLEDTIKIDSDKKINGKLSLWDIDINNI